MRDARRLAATLLVTLAVAGGAACGDSPGDGGDQGSDASPASAPGLEGPFALPFGLVELEGTEPVGRPVDHEDEAYTYNGAPVVARTLRAAYRVTGDDPPAALRDWVAQLDGLALAEGSIRGADYRPGPWLEASLQAEYRAGEPSGDSANLQLWATDAGPILLVSVSRIGDDPPRRPTVDDRAGDPPAPAAVDDDSDRVAGDVLFTEQNDEIHLPAGTHALMPTIPTFAGTGGSTSVLAAEDGAAAVRALLDEAMAASDDGEVTEPEATAANGTEVVTAGFVIPAGGWGFDVVSVRADGDPYATVYVTSHAD